MHNKLVNSITSGRWLAQVIVIFAAFLFALGANYVFSATDTWSPPQDTAPTCLDIHTGCNPPLNEGDKGQTKTGGLQMGSLIVTGASEFDSASTFKGSVNITGNQTMLRFDDKGGTTRNTMYVDTTTNLTGNGVLTIGNSKFDSINLIGGNVGIASSTPGHKLDVNGQANAKQLCIAGDCRSSWPSGGTSNSYAIRAAGNLAWDGTTAKTFSSSWSFIQIDGVKTSTNDNSTGVGLYVYKDSSDNPHVVGHTYSTFDQFQITTTQKCILSACFQLDISNNLTISIASGDNNLKMTYVAFQ